MIAKYSGYDVKVVGKDRIIVREDDVLGILEEGSKPVAAHFTWILVGLIAGWANPPACDSARRVASRTCGR